MIYPYFKCTARGKINLSRQSCFIWRTFMLDVRPIVKDVLLVPKDHVTCCLKWALKLPFPWDWSDWNMVLSMVLKPGAHPWGKNGHFWAYWRVLRGWFFQHFQAINKAFDKNFMDMRIKQTKICNQDVSHNVCTTKENLSQVKSLA